MSSKLTELATHLGQTPYEEVERVFADFKLPDDRGGVVRKGKKPYLPTLQNSPVGKHSLNRGYSPDFHVQMTFTEEQRRYGVIALTNLGALAAGEVLGTDTRVTSLADSTKNNYLQSPNPSFPKSLNESSLDLLRDFAGRFPNLMPATLAVFDLAGSEGLGIALDDCQPFLSAAGKDRLRQDNIDEFLRSLKFRDRFVSAHPHGFSADKPKEFELWCSGEAFSKVVYKQAAQAAISLAQAGVMDFRHELGLRSTGIHIKIAELVASLAHIARTEHYLKAVGLETREQSL